MITPNLWQALLQYRAYTMALCRPVRASELFGERSKRTPQGSKLVTFGAGLACFEMRPADLNAKYGVAIPHAEPKRYVASILELQGLRPEIPILLLTGAAYA